MRGYRPIDPCILYSFRVKRLLQRLARQKACDHLSQISSIISGPRLNHFKGIGSFLNPQKKKEKKKKTHNNIGGIKITEVEK